MPNKAKKGKKRPQYLLDQAGLGGIPEKWEDRFDYGADPSLHLSTLYDENETTTGGLIDEATGKPYKNDRNMPSELVHRTVTIEELEVGAQQEFDESRYETPQQKRKRQFELLINKPADQISLDDIAAMTVYYEQQA